MTVALSDRLAPEQDPTLSLSQLLDEDTLANPYPLYRRLQTEDPVHWDAFLHAWVVTSYAEAVTVFQRFSSARTPTPAQLNAMGLSSLAPMAEVMVRQMLFLDAPDHTRIRSLAAQAFTPRRVEGLRNRVTDIVRELLDPVIERGQVDVIGDIGYPLPAIVTAELLGVPASDRNQLKLWAADFAEVLGNFQHNPDRSARAVKSVLELAEYFREQIRIPGRASGSDLIGAFMAAEQDGDRFSEDEIIANLIITMVGGQETTTNLIGNGLLTLLRHPSAMQSLVENPAEIPGAVEELLRFESPSQFTARLAPDDVELAGKRLSKQQAVIVVMGAANRDPIRFRDPDRLDLKRTENRHLAFAWSSHYCFGAALARLEAQITFAAMIRRLPEMTLANKPLVWRSNLGLRGVEELLVDFTPPAISM